MPKARTIGLIYADMPQSRSYRRWLESLLAENPCFRDMRIVFRAVPLMSGEDGSLRMAAAEVHVLELDPLVDV